MDPEPEMTAVLERQMSNAQGSSIPRPQASTTEASNPAPTIPERPTAEQRELEQALAASREADAQAMDTSSPPHNNAGNTADQEQRELEQALAESRRQVEVDERRRRESQTYSDNGAVTTNTGGTIPGSYPVGDNGNPIALGSTLPVPGRASLDGLSGRMQSMDLMDDESGQQSGHRPLEPIRTGTNNPFASANDAPASPFAAGPRASSNNPFENPAYENGDAAGSSRTAYAPPSHPPPGWQNQNQAPSNPFLQPQRAVDPDRPPPVAPKPARPQSVEMGSGVTRGQGVLTHQLGLTQSRQGDDPSAQLKRYDMVLLVDDSGSMAGGRWRDTRMSLMEVAEQAAEHDTDGIDVYFINNPAAGEGIRVSRRDCKTIS
jgi:hypothetical protein